MTVGLENAGDNFGQYNLPPNSPKHGEEINLDKEVRDTRNRVHLSDFEQGTFNMRDPSHGAVKCDDPRAEYDHTRNPNLAYSKSFSHLQCRPVKGYRVTDIYDNHLPGENIRKFGGLPRTASGSCLTIKDARTFYYAHNPNHYGVNCGTFNHLAYHKEGNLATPNPQRQLDLGGMFTCSYSHQYCRPEPGSTRRFRMGGPDCIGFARPCRAVYDHDIKQFRESKLTKRGHLKTKPTHWKDICNEARLSTWGI